MYTIGEFSKINMVTPKTLRHYDEIGLLKPARIDRYTGYRYYTSGQLMRLHQILSLKQMGFSLTEVAMLLSGDCSAETMTRLVELKRGEIRASIEAGQHKLLMIESFLRQEKGDCFMQYTATITSLPEVIVASYRTTLERYDDLMTIMPTTVYQALTEAGATCAEPDYCFNCYLQPEYHDHDIDTEICQAVTELRPDTDRIKFKTLPALDQVLVVMHRGPYSNLRDAYGFAFTWMEQNGYQLAGLARESYIDGIWNQKSEEDWLTELQFPVKKV